ncbi:helix-turn-helix transcriptional regulator [Actinomadura barringtoniae]|uniref:Helix-turn-helix transcriptional regulator n=1 Tax=Actinomadura barringtoniae TaxID=1427535 RepID=A0A939T9P0_9ACTN|nr:helix-turn-helix domain-containing protein [Actinomadura barringtoniae]MBO2454479.1 helix-turn-helix transcriptional regulator [Actinomadura barringtoniae]
MGFWLISADTLAGGRFVVSALAETTACLKLLDKAEAAHPGERAWLDAHLGAYRRRLADDPITAQLVDAALGRTTKWNADFLTPPHPGVGSPGFHEEVAVIRRTEPERAHADLEVSLGRPLPAELRRPDVAERVAGLLEWIWTEAVEPTWERRRRVIEADAVARVGQLSQGGWAAALDDMRPGMRWLGDGRLQVNLADYPPRDIAGAQLLFIPVTPRTGRWVAWQEPVNDRYVIVYPCSGPLVWADETSVPEGLERLLGVARAGVLVLLATPLSTTQLVALTGQRLGSVGRHLKVLHDARLIDRRRAGRSVLYYRTATGNALVDAQTRP